MQNTAVAPAAADTITDYPHGVANDRGIGDMVALLTLAFVTKRAHTMNTDVQLVGQRPQNAFPLVSTSPGRVCPLSQFIVTV